MMMADTPSNPASHGAYQLTLTKSEIAFLNATIELMLEEQGGRTESVTIAVDHPAAFAKAFVKLAEQAYRFVAKPDVRPMIFPIADYLDAALDALGGTTARTAITREQAEALNNLRTAGSRSVTLEELLELRDRLHVRQQTMKHPRNPE
jgi:hypothetical protein